MADFTKLQFVIYANPSTTLYVKKNEGEPYAEDGSILRPFNTIQEAVDKAIDNACIHILPGEYSELVSCGAKKLSLMGSDPLAVILTVDSASAAITSTTGGRLSVSGMKIFNDGAGDAISADNGAIASAPNIFYNLILSNDVTLDDAYSVARDIIQLAGAVSGSNLTTGAAEDSLALLTGSITDGDTNHAPTGNAVYDALALKLDASAIEQSIDNGDTTHVPSSDAIFDALALKLDTTAIVQTITNGVTTSAPSEDAVFDALALKLDTTAIEQTIDNGDTTHVPSSDAVYDALALKLDSTALVQTILNGDTTHVSSSDVIFDALALKANASDVTPWIKYSKTFSDFSTNAMTNTLTLFSTPAKTLFEIFILDHQAFTGGGAGTVVATVYSTIPSTDPSPSLSFTTNRDVFVGNGATPDDLADIGIFGNAAINFDEASTIKVDLTADVNLDQLTTGSLDIYFRYSTLP